MKSNKIFLKIFLFVILLVPYANANQKIVFLDIQKILTESVSGKYLNSNIEKLQNKKIMEFKKSKENFQNEEKKLIGKKNILEKLKFEEQVNILRTKIIDFNNKKKTFSESLNIKKLNFVNYKKKKYIIR